eukprot:jgi/Picre1/30198/NNA_005567.t1
MVGAWSSSGRFIPALHPKAHAAVYEFAVSARACPHARIPVYVGESTNVQNRHRDYGKDGSSLREYFDEVVGKQRLLLWRRISSMVYTPVVLHGPDYRERVHDIHRGSPPQS